jgi:tRNA(fMet)-specific endonuclease VapC
LAYLLDSNIVIHAMEGHEGVLGKLASHSATVSISALTLAELERGVFMSATVSTERRKRLDLIRPHLPVLAFDSDAAEAYGRIIGAAGLNRSRDLDRMIAGHAIAIGAILVTDNVDEFADIPGLSLENWAV